MQDFNQYVKDEKNNQKAPEGMDKNLYNLVQSLATRFDGKSQNELLMAIYNEAKKGKQSGRLTNADIDNFATMLLPILDDKKAKMLKKIVGELKRI